VVEYALVSYSDLFHVRDDYIVFVSE
jgi:hypothetical protein